MQFLYPKSRQFPMDEVCERIVRELEKRNWDVPGITVEHDTYGSGDEKMTLVGKIDGADFRLLFGRPQGLAPGGRFRFNDVAAVSELTIPGKDLNVYEDESGPTLYLYVGNDWEKDRERFMNGPKVNSKLYGEPKTYLEYEGQCGCRQTGSFAGVFHTHPDRRPPLLVHTNDIGREYDRERDEPETFMTGSVMEEFRRYLTDVVLKTIMSHPIPAEKTGANL